MTKEKFYLTSLASLLVSGISCCKQILGNKVINLKDGIVLFNES